MFLIFLLLFYYYLKHLICWLRLFLFISCVCACYGMLVFIVRVFECMCLCWGLCLCVCMWVCTWLCPPCVFSAAALVASLHMWACLSPIHFILYAGLDVCSAFQCSVRSFYDGYSYNTVLKTSLGAFIVFTLFLHFSTQSHQLIYSYTHPPWIFFPSRFTHSVQYDTEVMPFGTPRINELRFQTK